MPAGGKPTMRSRRLGTALKRLRLAAQLDQDQAAEAVDCSTAKISRIESGIVSARVGDVRVLLDLYGVEDRDQRQLMEQLARDSNKRGWWVDYRTPLRTQLGDHISLETDATYIRTWQPVFVPGLLQTAAYTRALTDASPLVVDSDTAEEIIKVRQERRRKFEDSEARFAAVIWEPALTPPMPCLRSQREQLQHLISVAGQPNTTVQVLPLGAWAAARVSAPFTTFSFGHEWLPDAVAQDTLESTMILEDQKDVTAYMHAFDTLRSAALNPDQSLAFIRHTLQNTSTEDDNV